MEELNVGGMWLTLASIREQSSGVYVGGNWWSEVLLNHIPVAFTTFLMGAICVMCKQNGVQVALCLQKLYQQSNWNEFDPSSTFLHDPGQAHNLKKCKHTCLERF